MSLDAIFNKKASEFVMEALSHTVINSLTLGGFLMNKGFLFFSLLFLAVPSFARLSYDINSKLYYGTNLPSNVDPNKYNHLIDYIVKEVKAYHLSIEGISDTKIYATLNAIGTPEAQQLAIDLKKWSYEFNASAVYLLTW